MNKDNFWLVSVTILISVLMLIIGLSACSSGSEVDPESIGDPEKGRELFENTTRGRCISCHTLDENDAHPRYQAEMGPSLQGISKRAGERIPDMSAVEYLEQSILSPSEYIVEGYRDHMRHYFIVVPDEVDYMFPDMLSEEDKNNLIAFLLTQ